MSSKTYAIISVFSMVTGAAVSTFALYDRLIAKGEQNAVIKVAEILSNNGFNVAPLLSAEDTQTAFRNLDSMVREIVPANAPEAAPPPPDMAGLAVGEPIEMLINRVYRLTNSQVPVTLAGLSRDQARFRVNGEETDILLTQSIALPAPVAHCSLVFLGSSITGSGWYSSGDATATVSVDCRASAPGAALTDHQAPADEKQVRD